MIFTFNETGEYIVSISNGKTIKVIETSSRETLYKIWIRNKRTEFSSLDFTTDMKFLVLIQKSNGKLFLIKLENYSKDKEPKKDSILKLLNIN